MTSGSVIFGLVLGFWGVARGTSYSPDRGVLWPKIDALDQLFDLGMDFANELALGKDVSWLYTDYWFEPVHPLSTKFTTEKSAYVAMVDSPLYVWLEEMVKAEL